MRAVCDGLLQVGRLSGGASMLRRSVSNAAAEAGVTTMRDSVQQEVGLDNVGQTLRDPFKVRPACTSVHPLMSDLWLLLVADREMTLQLSTFIAFGRCRFFAWSLLTSSHVITSPLAGELRRVL